VYFHRFGKKLYIWSLIYMRLMKENIKELLLLKQKMMINNVEFCIRG